MNIKMKILKILELPICAFLLMLVVSCSENEQEISSASGIILRFVPSEVLTRGDSNVDIGTDAENVVNKIDVWLFPIGQTRAFYYTMDNPTGNMVSITEDMLSKEGMEIKAAYDVYVTANLPADATIGSTSTPDDLNNYIYDKAISRPSSPFCMTGKVVNHNFADGNAVTIPLVRNAVKLGITLVNETSSSSFTINKVTVRNDQQSVSMFEPAQGSVLASMPFAQAMEVRPADSDPTFFSTYINENLSNIPTVVEIEATMDGVSKTYSAGIEPTAGGNKSPKLPRNSACMITLRLKDAIVKVETTSSIVSWDEKLMNDPVSQVYLEIENSNVGVEFASGGEINVKSNVDKIHIDWSGANGFFFDGSNQNEDVADISLTNGSATLTFHLQLEDNPTTTGTVIVTAGNLSKAVTLTRVANGTIFELQTFNINDVGGLSAIEGKTLPWHLGDPVMYRPVVDITIRRNIRWFCHTIAYYEGEDTYEYEDLNDQIYNGTDAATLHSSLPINADPDRVMTIEVSLGIGDPVNNIIVRTIKFFLSPNNS